MQDDPHVFVASTATPPYHPGHPIYAMLDRAEHDRQFEALRALVRDRVAASLAAGPVFTTDSGGLWTAYLAGFPDPADRAYHTCNVCMRFVMAYGGLVTIDDRGRTASAAWPDEADVPEHYRAAVAAVDRLARRADVSGVFLSSDAEWGLARNVAKDDRGEPKVDAHGNEITWTHFHATMPEAAVYKVRPRLDADQAMAAKRHDFEALAMAIGRYAPARVDQALALLESDALWRAEAVIGPVRWFRQLLDDRNSLPSGRPRYNLNWRAVATAPGGFCHFKSQVAGTLLDDLANPSLDLDDVRRRFQAKLNPSTYQRPQAAPTAGNIKVAEKIIADLGLAPALERRYARLEEVEKIWSPKAVARPAFTVGGVFGHLTPKGAGENPCRELIIPVRPMTWVKFRAEVLPGAEALEFLAQYRPESYAAMVTATHAGAPPILRWDDPEKRNPVSWYFHLHGSTPSTWNLSAGAYHQVLAISPAPWLWNGGLPLNMGEAVLLILKGARDTQAGGGLGLFPAILRGDLREVHPTIEAFSNAGQLSGQEEATACGIAFGTGKIDATLRVRSGGRSQDYLIDRWD